MWELLICGGFVGLRRGLLTEIVKGAEYVGKLYVNEMVSST